MSSQKKLIEILDKEGVLKNPYVRAAFERIDRKKFLPPEVEDRAYDNEPLPIGEGQTISQPSTVAFMLDLLDPQPGQKILDIGSGSGWTAALLADIVRQKEGGRVYAIELVEALAKMTQTNIEKYPDLMTSVEVIHESAEGGLPEEEPFDRIISAAAADKIPKAWKKQLKVGGKMVVPVEDSIVSATKTGVDAFEEKDFPGFIFVPFIKDD